jgi:glycosyltransferase involved in cell wall biosynthesis
MDAADFTLQNLPTRHPHLRIAVVTETFPPEINGVAMTLGRMVEALQMREHQVQLIRPKQGPDDRPIDQPGLSHHLQRGVKIPRYDSLKMGLPAKAALTRLWTFQRPDIVHIATEGPLGWSALGAAIKLKLPVATDFHTNFHSYSQHYGLGFLRRAIVAYLRKFHNRSQLTLVPTEGIRQELIGCGYENVEVVARGVDTGLFHPKRRSNALRQEWGVGPDDLVVNYVGRLAPEKNLSLVIETFDAIRARRPDARLVMVGDGPERAGWMSRRPDLILPGAKTGEALAEHYASGDIFLFPSLTETYGNVTMEAMASGLAVVAYDYAAAEAHIQQDENGVKATLGDKAAFIREASALACEPARIRRLGQAAVQTTAQLSWQSIYDRFETLLVNLVQQSREHHFAGTLASRSA